MSKVAELREWFKSLDRDDQEQVVKFLYGEEVIRRGEYFGPYRGIVNKGLYCGPAPANVRPQSCPTCGNPY